MEDVMADVKRIYVEKKEPYAVAAKELKQELKSYLGIDTLSEVRVLIRYDVESISEDVYKKALVTVFSEPPVDDIYEGRFPKKENDKVFSVEYLPGQFDQRADSAEQCVKLLNEKEEPIIRSATTYVLSGDISEACLLMDKVTGTAAADHLGAINHQSRKSQHYQSKRNAACQHGR